MRSVNAAINISRTCSSMMLELWGEYAETSRGECRFSNPHTNPVATGQKWECTIADCFRQEGRGKVMSVWTLPVLLGKSLNLVYFGLVLRSLFHCLSDIRAKLTELK